MRRGRQEDSHEFLRYAIDAMQKACLNGASPYVSLSLCFLYLTFHCRKVEAKLAEATWVHKIFGGKLRSRVSCQSCGHNSDTFDRILDLSLDIIKADSLKEALKSFISPDYLKGADKYKCEKWVWLWLFYVPGLGLNRNCSTDVKNTSTLKRGSRFTKPQPCSQSTSSASPHSAAKSDITSPTMKLSTSNHTCPKTNSGPHTHFTA